MSPSADRLPWLCPAHRLVPSLRFDPPIYKARVLPTANMAIKVRPGACFPEPGGFGAQVARSYSDAPHIPVDSRSQSRCRTRQGAHELLCLLHRPAHGAGRPLCVSGRSVYLPIFSYFLSGRSSCVVHASSRTGDPECASAVVISVSCAPTAPD